MRIAQADLGTDLRQSGSTGEPIFEDLFQQPVHSSSATWNAERLEPRIQENKWNDVCRGGRGGGFWAWAPSWILACNPTATWVLSRQTAQRSRESGSDVHEKGPSLLRIQHFRV